MLDYFVTLAASWPIAFMVVGCSVVGVINARAKQSFEQQDEIRNLRANQAVVVSRRQDTEYG